MQGWVPAPCKKAGAGVAVLVPDPTAQLHAVQFQSVALAGSTVAGRQTVPRAELTAIKLAVEAAAPGGSLVVYPDASYTCNPLAAADQAVALGRCE